MLFNCLSRLLTKSRVTQQRGQLRLESLEDRLAPAVIDVIGTADNTNPVVTAGHAGTDADPFVAPSLRSAITFANTHAGGNRIDLAVAGTYPITLRGSSEDSNASGDLDILPGGGDLTIANNSGGTVVVDGNNLDRVFDINPGNTNNPSTKFLVTFQGFAITGGIASPGDLAGGSGGGIRDQGNASLTLNGMTLTSNSATADGGGISMENAPGSTPWTLTLNNSTLSHNHAGDAGGGIDTDGSGMVFINAGSKLEGNSCVNQGAAVWLDAIAGAVDSVSVTSGGSNYVDVPNVIFSSGGGSGAAGIATIDAAGHVTGVTITSGGSGYTSAPTVTLSSSTGTGASATATVVAFQCASLSMTGVVVDDNSALAGPTGAIGNAGNGMVTISNCTVENNHSGSTGGGFGDENNLGTLVVTSSLFQGNSAITDGGGIQEGGPSTTISNSLIRGNSSGGDGGGLFVDGSTLTLTGSTIAGNTAAGNGGGIELQTTATTSTISNTTITGNSALNANGGDNGGGIDAPANFTGAVILMQDTITSNFASMGGGVFYAGTTGSGFSLRNTIVANNSASVAQDASGIGFTDLGGNLIGVSGGTGGNSGFTAATTQTGNGVNPLDPQLGPLQDNGGATVGAATAPAALLTETPLPGSPALNKGVTTNGVGTDERGYRRPAAGSGNPAIGALELLTAQERFVQAVYLDELGRAGATAELDGWVALLRGPGGQQGVASAILHSTEGRDHLVKGWYATYLGRPAQGGEERVFVNMLLAGQTEEQALSVLLGSTEFTSHAQALVSSGTAQQNVVQALYEVLLERAPSPAELNAQVSNLATMGQQGLLLAFLQSQEYRSDVVGSDYVDLLHRGADPVGVSSWVFSNMDLGSIRLGFEASSEFFSNG
jgi:parallel beta-helix repeat protein